MYSSRLVVFCCLWLIGGVVGCHCAERMRFPWRPMSHCASCMAQRNAASAAGGGGCAVCATGASSAGHGGAEAASAHPEMRYFPTAGNESAQFDAARAGGVNITGTTACAACSYGVRPIGDSQSLGIAVVAGESVYVVEGGEKRYPRLFDARFDAVPVRLTGTIKRKDGRFVWVEPTSLDRVR